MPSSASTAKGAPPAKVEASYTDTCRRSCKSKIPPPTITYAVSVQNESGRSAGLSNQVQVPSAPTLPPPRHFRAEVKSDGVLLSWDCPRMPAASPSHHVQSAHLSPRAGKAARRPKSATPTLSDCRDSTGQPSPEFLDQTFEWEKHYDYRATVVTVVAATRQARG